MIYLPPYPNPGLDQGRLISVACLLVGSGMGSGGVGCGLWAGDREAARASRDGKTKTTKSVRHPLPLRVDA